MTFVPPPTPEELAAECARLQHLEEDLEGAELLRRFAELEAQTQALLVLANNLLNGMVRLKSDLERRVTALEAEVRRGPDPRLWAGDPHDPHH